MIPADMLRRHRPAHDSSPSVSRGQGTGTARWIPGSRIDQNSHCAAANGELRVQVGAGHPRRRLVNPTSICKWAPTVKHEKCVGKVGFGTSSHTEPASFHCLVVGVDDTTMRKKRAAGVPAAYPRPLILDLSPRVPRCRASATNASALTNRADTPLQHLVANHSAANYKALMVMGTTSIDKSRISIKLVLHFGGRWRGDQLQQDAGVCWATYKPYQKGAHRQLLGRSGPPSQRRVLPRRLLRRRLLVRGCVLDSLRRVVASMLRTSWRLTGMRSETRRLLLPLDGHATSWAG
jgi:hypothetical protein